jgi:sulfide dehydrogenase cytochrome subunit
MRYLTLTGLLIACTLSAAPAFAADPVTSGMRLVATCANCHGTDGLSSSGAFASLPGRPKAEMLATLRSLRNGQTPATIMHQLLKGYSDQELELIAAYLENEAPALKKQAGK